MFVSRIHITILVVVALALIALSAARPTSGGGAETTYRVEPGDTLWAIVAQRYAGDPREAIWKIKNRNGLATSGLTPGTVLVLPR